MDSLLKQARRWVGKSVREPDPEKRAEMLSKAFELMNKRNRVAVEKGEGVEFSSTVSLGTPPSPRGDSLQ